MLISLLALMMAAPASAADMEARAVAACEDWWRPLEINAPATATAVAGNGLCINGFIDSGTDAAILARIAAADRASPPVVVVRSGGGEFEATMNVAEALQERRPTVIADTICASSCASYLIPAGARRIVRNDSFLLYHGGITMGLLEQARAQIQALAKADPKIDPATETARMRATIAAQVARQDAFMARAGVRPEIFAWMDTANSAAAADHVMDCPPDSGIIQYSQAALGRFGLTFAHYGAPRSQAEVDTLLRRSGRDSKICYWQE
jgi:hypothetical protein